MPQTPRGSDPGDDPPRPRCVDGGDLARSVELLLGSSQTSLCVGAVSWDLFEAPRGEQRATGWGTVTMSSHAGSSEQVQGDQRLGLQMGEESRDRRKGYKLEPARAPRPSTADNSLPAALHAAGSFPNRTEPNRPAGSGV